MSTFNTNLEEKSLKLEKLEITEYHGKKKVSGAMKLLPISLFSKIIHLLLQKLKAHTPFFSCHLKHTPKKKMETEKRVSENKKPQISGKDLMEFV